MHTTKNLKLVIVISIASVFFIGITFIGLPLTNRSSQAGQILKSDCQNVPENLKQQCYGDLLERVAAKMGVQKSIEFFKQILLLHPKNCHGLAHILGEITYKQYKEGEKFSLDEDTLYCDFGFWHGFMGELAKSNKNNPKEVKKFCQFVSSQLSNSASSVESSCYHGVGIGSIEDPPDIKLWGNTDAIIGQSTKLCEVISDNGSQLSSCISGVFHGVIDLMMQNKYKFFFDKNNPFSLCIGRGDKYQKECFMQLAPKLPHYFNNDLSSLLNSLESVDNALRYDMIYIAAASLIQNSDSDIKSHIQSCMRLPQDYQSKCITGSVKGLMDSGEAGKEYVKALEFCKLVSKDSDKKSCFAETVSLSKNIYPKNKLKQVCSSVEVSYQPEDTCNIIN